MKMTVTVMRTTEREVLPCPFCGEENLRIEEFPRNAFAVKCKKCSIWGELSPDQNEAVDKWNTRKYIPKK